jgi:hypothetical protein
MQNLQEQSSAPGAAAIIHPALELDAAAHVLAGWLDLPGDMRTPLRHLSTVCPATPRHRRPHATCNGRGPRRPSAGPAESSPAGLPSAEGATAHRARPAKLARITIDSSDDHGGGSPRRRNRPLTERDRRNAMTDRRWHDRPRSPSRRERRRSGDHRSALQITVVAPLQILVTRPKTAAPSALGGRGTPLQKDALPLKGPLRG